MVDTVLALESGKWAGRLYYSILMLKLKARIISTITFAFGVTIRDIFSWRQPALWTNTQYRLSPRHETWRQPALWTNTQYRLSPRHETWRQPALWTLMKFITRVSWGASPPGIKRVELYSVFVNLT
jgi:hypothetical protein